MIEMSDVAVNLQTLPGASVRHLRVESWLDGELLADDIPVTAGEEIVDRSARVPERVRLTVPRRYVGADWSPLADPEHPLAANGQRLRVSMGIGVGSDVEWIQRGEFVVWDSELQGDDVAVEAFGLLALIDEARMVSPYQPTGTLKSTLRGLIEPALTVVFDGGLVDRAVPAGINFDEDRLGAVGELLDAWPAEMQVTAEGYLVVRPPATAGGAVLSVWSGNLVKVTGKTTRDDTHNCVVARGTAADGTQVQGVAYVGSGPHRYPGPWSALPVPRYFASPLLTTVAQCQAAARTVRDRMVRENSRPMVGEIIPAMFVQAGDVALVADENDREIGKATIEAFTLPYTAGGGAMRVTMVEVPS